jgi:hypothetical protein
MNANLNWHNVARLVWVSGGVVAVNEPGSDVQILAGMGGRNIHKLQIDTYASLFEVLRGYF